jgi:hypothetical protein
MSKICPQCGNPNSDETKFCTACGKFLDLLSDQSGPSVVQQTGLLAAGPQPDPNRQKKILAGAGIAAIVIIAIFLLITNQGIAGILSSSAPPVTTQMITTPVVTSYISIETPSPEPTPIPTENQSLIISVTDTPRISPTPTKPIVCPSDRRLCGSRCTDTMTDVNNCGACGSPCTFSQTCQQGVCMAGCTLGETNCFDGCYNLSIDMHNCGICGNNCPVGLECNKSICSPPLTTVIPTYIG